MARLGWAGAGSAANTVAGLVWLLSALAGCGGDGAEPEAPDGAPLDAEVDAPEDRAADEVLSPGWDVVSATADTFIERDHPDRPNGDAAALTIGAGARSRALVRFDPGTLAEVAAERRLVQALLELTVEAGTDVDTRLDAHALRAAWTEGGATWHCAVDAEPANERADCAEATAWSMDDSSDPPYEATPTDTATVARSSVGPVLFDVTADVAAFLGGQRENDGWIVVKADESTVGRLEISSREGAAPPRLLLEFEPCPDGVDRICVGEVVAACNPLGQAIVVDDCTGSHFSRPSHCEEIGLTAYCVENAVSR